MPFRHFIQFNPYTSKIHPITGYEGPGAGYRYSSTLSLTLALDGGGGG